MPTTFRQSKRAGYQTLLEAFMADFNSTALGKEKLIGTFRARPPSFNPPLAYVGTFREPAISHVMGLRTRQTRDELVLVQGLYDNFETVDRQDKLVDAFLDWLTANPHAAGANTVTQAVSTEDVELQLKTDAPVYFATVVVVESDIAEGRDST